MCRFRYTILSRVDNLGTDQTAYRSVHKILVLLTSANSEGKSAHICRLTRAFAAHINKVWIKMKAVSMGVY